MDSVCVTGCTGFIGSTMVDYLIGKGYNVIGVDRLVATNVFSDVWRKRLDRYCQICESHNTRPNLEILDLAVERDRLCKLLRKNSIDTVFMLGAVFGGREFVDRRQADCSIGFAMDQNTIRAAYEAGVERISFSSSACVYPNSLQKDPNYLLKESDILSTGEGWESSDNLYGFQKLMTERTLQVFSQEYGIKTSSLRFLTVYGAGEFPTSHAISMLTEKALRKDDPYVVWGTGRQQRGFTYVTDIVEGMYLAATKITDGTAINLGWDKRYAIKDVADLILKITDYAPKRIVYDASKPEGPFSRALDITLAKRLLGWTPKIDLREGLELTVKWLRENWK